MSRLVAERNFGVTHGASKLGITHAALAMYLRRRGIPL
jgi:predicted transcriptional regulator